MKNTAKEELEKWYLDEKLSTRVIAEKLECSQPWARKILKEFGIPVRSIKENKGPIKKGEPLSEAHKLNIGASLKGNTNWLDKKTGKHFNYQKQEVPCTYCGIKIEKKKCHLEKYKPFCKDRKSVV